MFYGNTNNLLQYARQILSDKVLALRNDVGVCINPSSCFQSAPFTALLACFSALDFLSALCCGNASTKASTTTQIKRYIETYFSYTLKQRELLYSIYRHKLVHLFQPGNVVKYKGHTYSWIIYNSDSSQHLRISLGKKLIKPAPSVVITIEYAFAVSISDFLEDIVKSSESYLGDLAKDANLQNNFDKAVNDIYGFEKHK